MIISSAYRILGKECEEEVSGESVAQSRSGVLALENLS